MYKQLSIKSVGILDDSTVFGVGIAGAFEAEFKKLGGTVAQHAEYKKEQTSDFKSILLGFKNKGAAAVYVGGTDDQNICIPRKQMKDIGWDAPFMGGDGIETSDCVDQASGNEPTSTRPRPVLTPPRSTAPSRRSPTSARHSAAPTTSAVTPCRLT